jgi:hypothetical protein
VYRHRSYAALANDQRIRTIRHARAIRVGGPLEKGRVLVPKLVAIRVSGPTELTLQKRGGLSNTDMAAKHSEAGQEHALRIEVALDIRLDITLLRKCQVIMEYLLCGSKRHFMNTPGVVDWIEVSS